MPPDPNIDMIGAQDVEQMQLSIRSGHVIYTGGAKGTDELAEEMAKHFGMQVDAIVPPKSSKGRITSVLQRWKSWSLANPHLCQAAQ